MLLRDTARHRAWICGSQLQSGYTGMRYPQPDPERSPRHHRQRQRKQPRDPRFPDAGQDRNADCRKPVPEVCGIPGGAERIYYGKSGGADRDTPSPSRRRLPDPGVHRQRTDARIFPGQQLRTGGIWRRMRLRRRWLRRVNQITGSASRPRGGMSDGWSVGSDKQWRGQKLPPYLLKKERK